MTDRPQPSWLPDLVGVEPWQSSTYDELYQIFCSDFKTSTVRFRSGNVIILPPFENGKEKIFWHITDKEDKKYSDRFPDIRRAERIRWIRAIIENFDKPEVLCWDYAESWGGVQTYLWLHEHDFLVILSRMSKGDYKLVTSFFVGYEAKRKNLREKYNGRQKSP